MNVALIALPDDGSPLIPPLTLAYVAAILEQRRHIVRIYDLALTPNESLTVSFRPLRAFRPQAVIVAGERLALLEEATTILRDQHSRVLPVQASRDGLEVVTACVEPLVWVERQCATDKQRLLGARPEPAVEGFADLDSLPFPARHLLSLESYGLRAVGGELQTTLLIGEHCRGSANPVLRSPAQIVAELRSVSREYGLRHYLFPGVSVTYDLAWCQELLTRLVDADLGVSWSCSVNVELLDEALLARMAQAGCEALDFSLKAARVFESAAARARLKQTVGWAHQAGICTHAHLQLEPPYEAVVHLVDVAATFSLDKVSFTVCAPVVANAIEHGASIDDQQVAAMARRRYHAGRSRQRLIDRFGPTLGTLIWKFRGSRFVSGVISEGGDEPGIEEQQDLPRPA